MYRSVFGFLLPAVLLFEAGCRSTDIQPAARAALPVARVASSEPARGAGAEATPREPQGTLTLSAAAALALLHNPDLKVFPYAMRAAEAQVLQVRLLPNPELEIEIEEVGGGGDRSGFDAAETTIQLGQLIELGGKRTKRAAVASLQRELVQWEYESARLDTMRAVAGAFVELLAAQDRLALAEDQLKLSRQACTAVVQRIEAGKDSPVDELRAGVVVSESRMERRRAEAALATARQQLAATWGGRTATFEKVVGDLYQVSRPPPVERAAETLAENPDVARWATEERARRAALRLEKARARPDVTISGGMQRFEETDDSAVVFGLAVPLPLFDRNQGGIERATANLGRTRQEAEAARIKARAALSRAVHALAAAYDQVNILQDEVLPKAQQAFEAAQRGYREGKFDYLYVLDAQRTLFETRARLVDTAETYQQARADVGRLTGRNLDAAAQPEPADAADKQSAQEDSHEE